MLFLEEDGFNQTMIQPTLDLASNLNPALQFPSHNLPAP